MSRRPQTFSERYPDKARSGGSANLIAGELIEARSLIPRLVDLRESEAFLERRQGPRRSLDARVGGHLEEHWAAYLVYGGFAALVFGWGAWMGLAPWWTVVTLVYMLVGGTLSGV